MYKKYHSGYISSDYTHFNSPPFNGKNFILSYGPHIDSYGAIEEGAEILGREIIIAAANEERAMNVSKLILSSIILLDSYILMDPDIPGIKPVYKNNINEDKFIEDRIGEYHRDNFPLACLISCKASYRRGYYYALLKYKIGCELFSIPTIDLDPQQSPYYKTPPFIENRIRMAQAIILFYSVVEELGLEIRANRDNPSFINGRWNPVIKNELENRLKRGSIDIDEEFYWHLRSTPTKIEKYLKNQRKMNLLDKALWAYGYTRDSKIKIVDAILLVSWMRSYIASHRISKSSELIKSLSIYDVDNANCLARRLLLERLGFWKDLF